MTGRNPTPADRLLSTADYAPRHLSGVAPAARRPSPAASLPADELDAAARHDAGCLMRVNHSGEIAAQALYHGGALTARQGRIRDAMQAAADEEADHLAWCRQRLDELGTRPSRLDPLWYAGSFAIGALAGLAGDRISLGFVAETERQVVAHLDAHLARLPDADQRSRAVLETMSAEEAGHGHAATAAGGTELPQAVRGLMRAVARVMTRTAYRI